MYSITVMKFFTERNNSEIVQILQAGGVGVLRTDTLYGVVASVLHEDAVERVYGLRRRDSHKACIILAADISQLPEVASEVLRNFMTAQWPGPVSVVISAPDAPKYLKRDGEGLAFRIPADEELRKLLELTGPLIAPSANLQGKEPAKSITEAKRYFGDTVDFYIDSGEVVDTKPSQLWQYNGEEMERLR